MLTIRSATADDVRLIRRMIQELADFEQESDQVLTTEEGISRDGFGATPEFRAFIADWHRQPAGFALYFNHYSTWRGAGIYLEDLLVRPEFRERGIGTALLARVAQAAAQENRAFVRWAVLHRNRHAVGMYRALGANILDDWRTVLLAGDGLLELVKKSS
jgi:GNAT superfamily N-acetyltransferase